jgi:UDP-N-acetylmuramoylalanine-D-glutamate ligase
MRADRAAVFRWTSRDSSAPTTGKTQLPPVWPPVNMGATDAGIQQAIDEFKGLSHRLETVGWVRGVRFVNDSKATNVDAVKRALTCFDNPVMLDHGRAEQEG